MTSPGRRGTAAESADWEIGGDSAVRATQLAQFLGWLILAVLTFSALEIGASFVFADAGSGVAGATLLFYGCALLLARQRARNGRPAATLTIVCSGFLGATLIVAVAQPILLLTLIFAPLLAVGLALPYVDEARLRALFVAAWVVAVAAVAIGELRSEVTALPEWFQAVLRLASLSTALAVVLMLLWQFRKRLFSALYQARRAEERASHDATHDPLTELPNRVLFSERLERTLSRARADSGYLFAVLFLDLDRFKNINDSLGHEFGDRLLVEVARRVRGVVHPDDTVARMGGDEFTILLENLESPGNSAVVAERIKGVLAEPFAIGAQRIYLTASIGVVQGSGVPGAGSDDLLRDADTAMYRAKETGRGRYEMFSPRMREEVVLRLKLETDLRRAVEREEFKIYYQPVISLNSGGIVGFEALVRWEHPEFGLTEPMEFVPIAEETGLIAPIGVLVLRQACNDANRWLEKFPKHRPLEMSVNLSATQLSEPDLVRLFQEALWESGLRARHLRLEITESAIMRDVERATDTLSALRGLGVRVSVDDFGTGYASLSLLHQFSVDTLKVDRSFVQDIESSPENAQIVRSIVTLAHELGLDVVAEGVDAPGQLEMLRAIGCDYGQGFLFSKPVAASEAEELVSSGRRW